MRVPRIFALICSLVCLRPPTAVTFTLPLPIRGHHQLRHQLEEQDSQPAPRAGVSSLFSSTAASTPPSSPSVPPASGKHYVIIGGGWGGWGAAERLCDIFGAEDDTVVTLLDALPDPTGEKVRCCFVGYPLVIWPAL